MPFVHYLYIGHFERDAAHGHVRYVQTKPTLALSPVLSQPLDPRELAALLPGTGQDAAGLPAIPADWNVWFADGCVICDADGLSEEAVEFVTRLVKTTRSEIVYDMTGSVLDASQIRVRRPGRVRGGPPP
jgi:hypothetical protein